MITQKTQTNWMGWIPRVMIPLLVVAFGFPSQACAGIPVQDWVAKYNGLGPSGDFAAGMAVAGDGSVYVTGSGNSSSGAQSHYKSLTIKYDPAGNVAWMIEHGVAGYTDFSTRYVAVDPLGNVFILGFDEIGFVIVKIDSQGTELWAAHHASEGRLPAPPQGKGLVIDQVGCAYVVGDDRGDGTNWDYVTLKYDPSGNELWMAHHNSPGNGFDIPVALALDAIGNVYVTGSTAVVTPPDTNDFLTVKYDPAGNELWARSYNGPANGEDTAMALAVDRTGHVCVAGYSDGVGTYSDYATVMYDTNGNELWVARYNGPGNMHDSPYSTAIDVAGNVYVTGLTTAQDGEQDYATVKYDSEGKELWVARFEQGIGAISMVVDPAGNVYVTGKGWGLPDGWDYLTVKYDTEGNELWVARYDGPHQVDYEEPVSLALDSAGNVVVSGTSEIDLDATLVGADWATVKYDAAGHELWASRYDGPPAGPVDDSVAAMVLDGAGNVYVTGSSGGNATGLDYATIKYDSAGNVMWVARYTGLADDEAKALTVDREGSVYVTGKTADECFYHYGDFLTIKYDSEGRELWTARYDGPDSLNDEPEAIAVDAEGNVYVTGISDKGHNLPLYSDCVTIKYDAEGNELWVAREGTEGENDWGNSVAADAAGNVYVAGVIHNTHATVKYDRNGNLLWERDQGYFGEAFSLALDAAANVYVTGDTRQDENGYINFATVKYDTNGNQLWAAYYNGYGNGEDVARAMVVDGAGNVFVTGYSDGGNTWYDAATVKYDADGNEQWVARYNNFCHVWDGTFAIALDGSGNVYVAGKSMGFGTNKDYLLLKYSPDGQQLWLARYNGTANKDDLAVAVAVDASGSIYVAGTAVEEGTGQDFVTIKYSEKEIIWSTARPAEASTKVGPSAQGDLILTSASLFLLPLVAIGCLALSRRWRERIGPKGSKI